MPDREVPSRVRRVGISPLSGIKSLFAACTLVSSHKERSGGRDPAMNFFAYVHSPWTDKTAEKAWGGVGVRWRGPMGGNGASVILSAVKIHLKKEKCGNK